MGKQRPLFAGYLDTESPLEPKERTVHANNIFSVNDGLSGIGYEDRELVLGAEAVDFFPGLFQVDILS